MLLSGLGLVLGKTNKEWTVVLVNKTIEDPTDDNELKIIENIKISVINNSWDNDFIGTTFKRKISNRQSYRLK